MTRRRLTREQYDDTEAKVKASFLAELAQVTSLAEALALAARTPGVDEPGRRFYSNLAFLLQSGKVPGGSDTDERSSYDAFLARTGIQLPPTGE